MPILGITGGVATGKTAFSRELQPRLGAGLFDADREAAAVIAGDAGAREEIARHFGETIFSPDGALDRPGLRAAVFREEKQRRALETILHPRIRAKWTALAQTARAENRWLIVDIPLLYETGAETHFDRIVVVACAAETQRRRLREIRALDEETALGMLAAQLDLLWKIEKANHAVWNDAGLPCLREQAILLGDCLLREYG